MIDANLYFTFLAACIAVIIIPGPTVTVIIANSMRSGAWAGLANVAGTQLGLALTLIILAFGLSAIIAFVGEAFVWIKLVGAVYLIWLGISLWRAEHGIDRIASAPQKTSFKQMFLQGFFVVLANPKSLFFFGIFIPQFIDPSKDAVMQTLILGATFMIVATILDGSYAVLAGGAGQMLTRTRVRLLQRLSGTMLIAGGIWMALQKRS
uniref:LysE family translocator n=1 Tax=Pararhizobium sp. IMCC3301 TaxID=3067904 RepID=UPI0027423F5A|nr:LysE family translocator [Pararhizobium sp. IMCC3301]